MLYEIGVAHGANARTYQIGMESETASEIVMLRTGAAAAEGLSRYEAIYGRETAVIVWDRSQGRTFEAFVFSEVWRRLLVQLGLAPQPMAQMSMMMDDPIEQQNSTPEPTLPPGFAGGTAVAQTTPDPTPTPIPTCTVTLSMPTPIVVDIEAPQSPEMSATPFSEEFTFYAGNEILDMRSVVSFNLNVDPMKGDLPIGLIIHDGPTWNARRLGMLEWGTEAVVDAQFFVEGGYFEGGIWQNTGIREIWYRLDKDYLDEIWESNIQSGLERQVGIPDDLGELQMYANDGWINIYHIDTIHRATENGTGLNALVAIEISPGVTSAEFKYIEEEINPCNDEILNMSSNITSADERQIIFTYDRMAAARYGMAHAYRNSEDASLTPKQGEVYDLFVLQFATAFDTDLSLSTNNLPVRGRATQRILDTSIGSETIPYVTTIPFFYFSHNIDATKGNTGSAVFNSQNIWMGGMPLLNDLSAASWQGLLVDEACYSPQGWRFCNPDPYSSADSPTSNGDTGVESGAFANHDGIMAYFSDVSSNEEDSGGGAFRLTIETIPSSQHGETVAYIALTDINGNIIDIPILEGLREDGGNLLSAYPEEFFTLLINNQSELYASAQRQRRPLNTIEGNNLSIPVANISMIRSGDYVWTERGNPAPNEVCNDDVSENDDATCLPDPRHGFLIIGWGPIVDCPTALQTLWQLSSDQNSLYSIHRSLYDSTGEQHVNVVPYVVDFYGPFGSGEQLQRNRPRPFYCTQYPDEGFQLSRDAYRFNTLPDVIMIDSQLIYSGYTYTENGVLLDNVSRSWTWG